MRDVRDEAAVHAFAAGERICHVVERGGKLANLVIACDGHADGEIAVAEAFGCGGHLPQGLDEPVGEEADDNERQNERGGCGDEEHLQCGELILREGGSVHGGKNGTDGHSGAVFASCLGR